MNNSESIASLAAAHNKVIDRLLEVEHGIEVLKVGVESLRSDFSTAQAGNRDALTALADRIEHLRNDFRREAVGATNRIDDLEQRIKRVDCLAETNAMNIDTLRSKPEPPTAWAVVICEDPFEPKYISVNRISRYMNGRTFGEDVLVFDDYTDAESVANGYENAVVVRMDEETMIALPGERAA